MATRKRPDELLQRVVDAYVEAGRNECHAADLLGMNRSTFQSTHREAKKLGFKPSDDALNAPIPESATLKDQVRALEAQLKQVKKDTLDDEFVKRQIIKLSEQTPEPPEWLIKTPKGSGFPGVPTLFASDWHWGEVVDPNQINGVNEFNLKIAQDRAKNLVEVATDLLKHHIAKPEYPGIVFALGGDMVSGDIHDELSATNEREIMPTVIDLWGVLVWCIDTLADEFGNVFVPCVTGNHGRNTHKMRAKGRNFTSFDWLLYQFLAKRYEGDERVRFLIPDGSDAYYSVYGHRYLLTHGDQFRGGDGMIGALGPIIRGDHKKRSRNAQIDLEYDTLLIGHWHQLIQMQRLVVNGSLKGYDEYASQGNFPFEPPRQALWLTHPEHGITFTAPVLVDRTKKTRPVGGWISWKV